MTTLAEAILAVSLALPAPYVPPPGQEAAQEARQAFLSTLSVELASVVNEATCTQEWATVDFCQRTWPGSPTELAAMALTLAWFESRLDPRIARGECVAWGPSPKQIECDGRKVTSIPPHLADNARTYSHGTYVFTARSIWQIRDSVVSRETWQGMLGTGDVPVREAASAAVRVIASSRGVCRRGAWETCTIRNYAGASASWPHAGKRVLMFRRIQSAIARVATPE